MSLPPEASQALRIVWAITGLTVACQSLRLLAAGLAYLIGGAR